MLCMRVFHDRVCRLVSTVRLTFVLRALLYYVSSSILYLFQNETFQKNYLRPFPKVTLTYTGGKLYEIVIKNIDVTFLTC